MLSDRTINCLIDKGQLRIEHMLRSKQVQPASVDLRLGDIRGLDGFQLTDHFRQKGFRLAPLQFILGCTVEWIGMPANLVGQVHGKSTRARQGLVVHAAGFVDPGFEGTLTLELFNMSRDYIYLEYGMPICQIAFDWVDTTPTRTYGHPELNSHYQGQVGPTPARL